MKYKITLVVLIFGFHILVKAQNNLEEPPNVLFIICDDLNDYQGVFGGHPQAKTPNIDKLAAVGVQFTNAHTNVPVCSPSRNSLITGVYPHVSKDYGWTDLKKQPVLKNNKTLIRYFKENGYLTIGTGKITHGSIKEDWDVWGLPLAHNYGPIYFDGKKNTSNPRVPKPFAEIGGIDGSFGRLSDVTSKGLKDEKGWVYGWDKQPMRYINENDRDLLQDEKHAEWIKEKLFELEKQDNQTPFFMGVGFVRPHTPLHAPDKYFDMFPLDSINLDKWIADDLKDTYYKENFDLKNKDNKGSKYYKLLVESYNGDRELALKHFLQAYLACVAFVDDQIGKVLTALNQTKFKDNTIIILTSDHGWQMGEKEYLFKNSPWEESTRIPFIVKIPNSKLGLKIEHPVSLIDIFPTLKDYCNLKGDHKYNTNGGDLGGYSLRPFIEDTSEKWQGPNGALTIVGNYGIEIPTEKQVFTYRTEKWRYILYGNGSEELYNHLEDPYEWKNLALQNEHQTIKKQLKKEMDAIIYN